MLNLFQHLINMASETLNQVQGDYEPLRCFKHKINANKKNHTLSRYQKW
jgi:hypothetical protein